MRHPQPTAACPYLVYQNTCNNQKNVRATTAWHHPQPNWGHGSIARGPQTPWCWHLTPKARTGRLVGRSNSDPDLRLGRPESQLVSVCSTLTVGQHTLHSLG